MVLGFTRSGFLVSSDLFLDSQDLSSWSLMDLFLDSRDLFVLITGYSIQEPQIHCHQSSSFLWQWRCIYPPLAPLLTPMSELDFFSWKFSGLAISVVQYWQSLIITNTIQTTVLDFKRVATHWSLPVIVHSDAYECTIQWSWSLDKCFVTEVSRPSNQYHNLLVTKLCLFLFSFVM